MTNINFFQELLETSGDKIENLALCRSCGGLCCKREGCSYLPFDIELTQEALTKKLALGDTSITASIYFDMIKNKCFNYPILTLRARNRNKGIINLISEPTRCASLTDQGCKLAKEDRPSGSLSLIPREGGLDGSEETRCYSLFENYQLDILKSWLPYQRLLVDITEQQLGIPFEQEYKKQLLDAYINLSRSQVEYQSPSNNRIELAETFEYMDMASLAPKLTKPTKKDYIETPKIRTYFRPFM